MNAMISLAVVGCLFLIGSFGSWAGFESLFGIIFPYAAVALFILGFSVRVMGWAAVPVPFRIPTTCGQQRSLAWIKQNKLDNPSTAVGTIGRVALEVLFFRSLLRNTKSKLTDDGKLVYGTDLSLWVAAMAMHWSLLIVLIRHLRLFTNPVPVFVSFVTGADGFFEVGLPVVFLTSGIFLVALLLLLARRLVSPPLRYISIAGDYFALFLLLGIGASGFVLRHLIKTDISAVKELATGLAHFSPVLPAAVSPLLYGHLFLVSVLLAYFPVSKLVHMAAMVMSPTRNLANNNRFVRHVNPWDYPVKVHSYEEYEDELRDKMKTAGIALEKE